MIDGVQLIPLDAIFLEDGSVLKMMSSNSKFFQGFGEIYFSEIKQGAFKGWKKHVIHSQNIAVPSGEVMFQLFDDRSNSPTRGLKQNILLSRINFALLIIPPDIWYGFSGLNFSISLIANILTKPYDRGEVVALPQGATPF